MDKCVKNSNIQLWPAGGHYVIHTYHLAVKSIFSIEGHLKGMHSDNFVHAANQYQYYTTGYPIDFLVLVLSAICDATSEALRLCVFLCHSPMVT